MQDRKIFIDTHVHTIHSELDGLTKLEEYVNMGIKNNFPALFISDHGNISGWIPFYELCVKNNIKPVLGSEFYLSEGQITENTDSEEKSIYKNNFHLNIYAKNKIGYHNIIKLTTWANMKNFYRKPRITFEVLKQYSEGLIVTTSCVGSIFAYYILNNKPEVTKQLLLNFQQVFGDDFYIEYGYHKFENEKKYVEQMRRFAKDLGIKTIMANDTHYLNKEDEVAHKILMCKGSQTLLDKSNFNYEHNYYKSYTEMCDIFAEFGGIDIDTCMNNTFEIISKVENYNLEFGKFITPELKETNGLTQDQFLLQKIQDGVKKRFNNKLTKEQVERIKTEFGVIKQMNFSGYFNIVQDYVNWCKNNGIPVGPGRGSGVGSFVNYLIGITDVNPLTYNLIFERFLNVGRKSSFPDIDGDYETSKRPILIQHLTEQYGQKGCVPISTRGFLKGKSSIKTVASKMNLDFNKYNSLLSDIKDPKIDTVQKVIDSSEKLSDLYKNDEEFKKVVDVAKKLEGGIQSISVHASAVCLELEDISNFVPIIRTKDGYATGWTDKIVEKCGLIKYDLLGLSNLSVIDQCCKLIGNDFDIKNIPLDDKKTFGDLQLGDNLGKFQIESNGMKSLLLRLKPESIEHLSAILALYRPGAMQFIDEYIKGKNNPNGIQYFDPRVKPILERTYGQMIYQEQVMKIAQVLAGYTLSEADILRKILGKKRMEDMLQQRSKFVTGCVQNGLTEERATELFEQIVEFANYSFNFGHSAAYSYITYQTAYLKSNYPVQFMCALLNCNSDNLDKMSLYLNECFRLGIPVLPPDINESGNNFTINNKGEIRFGFNAIKGVGITAIKDVMKVREKGDFTSVTDLIKRTTKVDRSNIQTLLKVGAFNSLEPNPKRWVNMLEYLTDAKNSKQYTNTGDLVQSIYTIVGTKQGKKSAKYIELQNKKRELKTSKTDKIKKEEYTKQQNKLIELYIEEVEKAFTQYTKYEPKERIQFEQELLGFNISTNPYKRWNQLKKFFIGTDPNIKPQYVDFNKLMSNPQDYNNNERLHTVAILSGTKEIKTKRGKKMAWLTVEYFGVKSDITVFPDQWESIKDKLQKGNMVAMTGRIVEVDPKWNDGKTLGFKLETIRQLDVLVSENIKCIIDMTGRNREDIDTIVKQFAVQERSNNEPISKVVLYKFGDKVLILNGLCWVNNPRKLVEKLG